MRVASHRLRAERWGPNTSASSSPSPSPSPSASDSFESASPRTPDDLRPRRWLDRRRFANARFPTRPESVRFKCELCRGIRPAEPRRLGEADDRRRPGDAADPCRCMLEAESLGFTTARLDLRPRPRPPAEESSGGGLGCGCGCELPWVEADATRVPRGDE